jgi:PleD family two-component response regulator
MDQENLREVAERIRRKVADLDILTDGGKVTTSIGVVTAHSEDTVDSLCRRVDRALYEAKRTVGKNTVVML